MLQRRARSRNRLRDTGAVGSCVELNALRCRPPKPPPITATFLAVRPMCKLLTPRGDAGEADGNCCRRGNLDSRLPEARRSTSASPVREAVRFERRAALGLVEGAVPVQVL